MIETTLRPHLPQPERIFITGPSLPLGSHQVLGMSLALHELATDAAKYAALSNNDGAAEMSWSLVEGAFHSWWEEKHAPEVSPVANKGSGSTLLQRTAGSYFDGTSEFQLDPHGAIFESVGRIAA